MKNHEIVWINSKDQQPTENGTYLVTMRFGHDVDIMHWANGAWNTFIGCEGRHHDENAMEDSHILAWATLPPAYKEGE